ncbi:response regulator [uncultured Roseobacter sp.]|uniref:response regulator n=1 Tax=uncultured Roseobacter sp. TaxID=114847 RepID=UPI00261E6552|nr:response regulator [uncultured Roseobacter sp.]
MRQSNAVRKAPHNVISALIVDDNAFDRRRIARLAQSTGLDFVLHDVSTVEEFHHALDRDRFDIIFVDLNLAGANGMSLLPAVRLHRFNRHAAMIMISGNDKAEVALEALRTGFADYIDKDNLNSNALERATLNALEKTRLNSAVSLANSETRSVETVLTSFARACSEEVRPMLLRMTRQLSQLRTATDETTTEDRLAEIEESCSRMEEFFTDLESLAQDRQLSTVAMQSEGVRDVLDRPVPVVAELSAALSPVWADRPAEKSVVLKQQPVKPPKARLFSKKP